MLQACNTLESGGKLGESDLAGILFPSPQSEGQGHVKKQPPESHEQLELMFPTRESPVVLARRGPISVLDGGAGETPQSRSAARSKEAKALRAEMAARREEAATPAPRPGLRVIQGGGQKTEEKLGSRDAVVRVLIEAGADMLLKRISSERATHIEQRVNKIMDLFDRVDDAPSLMPILQRQLDELEALMSETRGARTRRPG